MRFHEFFADGKPEAQAIDRGGFRQPVKFLEDSIEVLFRHAAPSIGHDNF